MADKEIIRVSPFSEGAERLGVPISTAVRGNGMVFVSGMPPLDPRTGRPVQGDMERKATQCLENVRTVLETAGSSLEKVLKVTVYATDPDQFAVINRAYARFFREDFPARTFVAVKGWPEAMGFDIEIECTALA
ncbi:MAG TPA: Rid family hydrolase [Gammaproteobacteria bacterium]|nr:Rid family hydrolase [Gammaproteobacteria bacterium]HYW03552.1 Rid family hydrolase [Gammaproteobacteria bacterium]